MFLLKRITDRSLSVNQSTVIEMYCTRTCPYCRRARRIFETFGIPYIEYLVDRNPRLREIMQQRSLKKTVPQIFAGDVHIGGYDDLLAIVKSRHLYDILSILNLSRSRVG